MKLQQSSFYSCNPVKIFVVEPYTRTPGHFERLSVRTCEALARLGNNVTLVTYGGIRDNCRKGPGAFAVADAAPVGTTEFDWRRRNGKVHLGSLRGLLKRQLWEFRTFRLTVSLLRQQELGIAHFYDADPILLVFAINLLLAGRRHKPRPVLVLTVHDVIRLTSPKGIRRKIYYWFYRRCLGRLIRHDLDGIVVLDSSLKQGLLNCFGVNDEAVSRIRVLPHGIGDPVEASNRDAARRRLNLNLTETIFLVFGILRNDKRIDLAIEAIKELPHCRLIIAGEPHDFTETFIKELVHRNGCEQSVSTEINYIPEERMHDYFSACDAAIIPYDRSFKGLSGILTLACGHGKAVIASNVGILGETVKEHGLGFVVEPNDASAIREAILRFLSLTTEERAQIEQRVETFADLMSWDSVCAQWAEFYQWMLKRRELPD